MKIRKLFIKFILSSSIYNYLINRNELKEISFTPPDSWPGDPYLGENFFHGHYNLAGKKVFSPKKNYYEGITYKFFNTKIKRIIKKDILIKDLKKYDEIILIGSGKGVASVKTIKELNWFRKKFDKFKTFSKYYHLASKNCKYYNF